VFLTRDQRDRGSTATTTTATTLDTAPVISQATITSTTAAPTTTTAPPQTTTTLAETIVEPTTTVTEPPPPPPPPIPPIPEGAADLGNGVALPIPAGFVRASGALTSMVTLTNNQSVISAGSSIRQPGIDPMAITQEYVNAFDRTFDTIAYSPTARNATLPGEPPTDVYTTFFVTYDVATATSQSGTIEVYIRADGLVLVLSVYGPTGASGVLPSDAMQVVNDSFQVTPLVGEPAPLAEFAPFRVTSAHPAVVVDGLTTFSPTPGFTIVSSGNGRGVVTRDGVLDMQIDKYSGQVDTATVTASAQAVLAQRYTALAYSQLWRGDPDPWGVVHGAFTFIGTDADGRPGTGMIDLYLDPATANALVSFRTWANPNSENNPFPAETNYMLQSLLNSFTNIP
ncbi:MAG TPA: hypothetical protein PLV68_20685, partial [Ilumatobacteraceae bacterium]|nr:hypothetical protein [Ilumatobacteraceae bacterium]